MIESEDDIVKMYQEYVSDYNVRKKIGQDDDPNPPQVYGGIVFEPNQSFESSHLKYKIRIGYRNDYSDEAQTQYLFDPWMKYNYYGPSDALYR